MTRRLAITAVAATLALAASGERLAAQPAIYGKLAGTWVYDSATAPDDHGGPKSESIVFTIVGEALRVDATEDMGKGPVKSGFECTTKGALRDAGSGVMTRCTMHPYADSVVYAVDVLQDGKVVSGERGRLVVTGGGKSLRDEYDATDVTEPPSHHRHRLTKQQ
jgi:hypothetical protein